MTTSKVSATDPSGMTQGLACVRQTILVPQHGSRALVLAKRRAEPQSISHERAIAWALDEYRLCDRQSIVDAFLKGIELNRASLRAPFSAYAVATHLAPHAFVAGRDGIGCRVCGEPTTQQFDFESVTAARETGAIDRRQPVVLAAYLARHRQAPIAVPGPYGTSQFQAILDVIDDSGAEETPSTLFRRIRRVPGLRLNVDEARQLLATLGYAGILQTPQHRGFLYRYTNFVCPHKSRSSEWAYPIDFWKGVNGINTDALAYWFDAYPSIAGWQSRRPR